MKVTRKQRLGKRQAQAIVTKLDNRRRKEKERVRREGRMIDRIKTASLPYTPDVMSWLSAKLGVISSRITDTDIASLRT